MTLHRIVKTNHVEGDTYVMRGGTYVGRLVSVEPVTIIKIDDGITPASWESTYNEDGNVRGEACVVYSCDGCSAEWSIPDGAYALVGIGEETP